MGNDIAFALPLGGTLTLTTLQLGLLVDLLVLAIIGWLIITCIRGSGHRPQVGAGQASAAPPAPNPASTVNSQVAPSAPGPFGSPTPPAVPAKGPGRLDDAYFRSLYAKEDARRRPPWKSDVRF